METLKLPVYRFCPSCGGVVDIKEHEGRKRPVCNECGLPIYVNPIPATCQIVLDGGRVLLTKRSVEPRAGWWCLPGGFIEWGESPEDGAKRELAEETGIVADSLHLTGVYDSITGETRHVLLVAYRVDSWHGDAVAGDDAEEVAWVPVKDIPELAFDVHTMALADALRPGCCH
jgi:8-oxo-dGTP diphosphatase